ncbi:threonine-phosphate decarboxylase CobD [Parahaliea mediterranea]|uniref:threonine-phosphate decarboxylase CobD n=1 Tax=Parahaliea mediterranea TaxID=651086 RepID=UPI000E2ECFC1|nr:threonine-phosphate decarboxylase CobD [Parahaliea mediterranea]
MASEVLEHGGRLSAAIARYGGSAADWLDLSTGISPFAWPVPPVPPAVWQRLPEDADDLVPAAARYYGCAAECLLPVPGSQHAISHLPRLWPQAQVALPYWGYQEHHRAWSQAGHHCLLYGSHQELQAMLASPSVRYAVVINPNNPAATLFAADALLPLAAVLHQRGGRLLVDEAFVDPTPAYSLASRFRAHTYASAPPGLVVLRSLGKFFGLAGLRLGFVLGPAGDLAALAAATDPWAVSHPARWVGAAALCDGAWQAGQRRRLQVASRAWRQGLAAVLPALAWTGTDLFASARLPAGVAFALQAACAQRRLLLRVIDAPSGEAVLRLGLPEASGEAAALGRLQAAAQAVGLASGPGSGRQSGRSG